jgi:cytochrome b561
MQFRNREEGFGLVAILLHWIMAILMIGMIGVGLYMTSLAISEKKLMLYGWHKAFGVLVLMLFAIRLLWRLSNITPSLSSLPYLERLAARSMHLAFYGFMVAMPLTGWLMSSSAGLPVSFFGLFTLPDLVMPNEKWFAFFREVHKWLAFGLIAAILGHTAAALKHHFMDKDDILRRMLWP